jgi:AcrR family transcriptional regulator
MPGRAGLDKAGVVRAAVALVNAEGAEALTINRLARELKVQPPSLYNHIGGLPELRRALALVNAQWLGDQLTEAALGKSGPEGIRALALAYRAYIRRCPGLYQSSLVASGNLSEPFPELQAAEERVVRVVLALVASLGVEGEAAIHQVRGLRALVHGFATLEVAGGFGLPINLDESFDQLIAIFLRGIPVST